MARLPILESTIKQLYGTATSCAHADCDEPLLRWVDGLDAPVLNSRIAHIHAASPFGPRYSAVMTDEDRRAFENLILLCLPHAEEIDLTALSDRYPAEALQRWKAVQLQSAPPEPPNIPESVLERAVVLSMGDVLMDFRDATIEMGGKAAAAPGAGGSGGGAIGPGARGGDGGPGGDRHEYVITGLEVLGDIPVEVGRAGRGGIDGLLGEASGHTRFGGLITRGAGREEHSPFPEALYERVSSSVSAAVLTNYAEVNNGLCYLAGAGWSSYSVTALPAPFHATLCLWVDVSWADLQPGTEVPLEVIVELITPSKTATFSEKSNFVVTPSAPDGFTRQALLFALAGTLHDPGLHVLDISCNTGARLGQYLDVVATSRIPGSPIS